MTSAPRAVETDAGEFLARLRAFVGQNATASGTRRNR